MGHRNVAVSRRSRRSISPSDAANTKAQRHEAITKPSQVRVGDEWLGRRQTSWFLTSDSQANEGQAGSPPHNDRSSTKMGGLRWLWGRLPACLSAPLKYHGRHNEVRYPKSTQSPILNRDDSMSSGGTLRCHPCDLWAIAMDAMAQSNHAMDLRQSA